MEIVVDEKTKTVTVWMRRDETGLREQLKPEFAKWKKAGYLPAVFLSGDKDLTCCTSDLLCYNRKRLAETAVEREKIRPAAL